MQIHLLSGTGTRAATEIAERRGGSKEENWQGNEPRKGRGQLSTLVVSCHAVTFVSQHLQKNKVKSPS